MAIDLATGFNIGSKDVIDERQVLTLEQMKNLDESIYPDKYFAICKDDGKLYLYNSSNEVNDETGKFREISGSDNVVDTDNFLKSYTELSQLGLTGDAGVWDVIQALDPGAMAHIRTNGFNNASTIFPINDSGVLYIVKGNDDVYLHGTQVMWTSKQGGCAIGVIGSGSFDGWNVLSGSLSSNKKLIFNNRFSLYTYTLLAKIVLPDDSVYRHNIRITCAHKVNTSSGNWMFKENIDICKFDLHFTNPPLTSAYVNNPTMKQYGLTVYEYPFPEGTDEGIKKISENIRLYYDKTSYTIYVYLFNNENLFAGAIGRQLIGLTVENIGDIEIAESLLSDGVWNAPWNCQCEFDDLEAPTIVKVGGGSDSTTTTYTSLTELGLTSDATVDDVLSKLQPGETFTAGVNQFTNYQTLFPYDSSNDQYSRVFIQQGSSLATAYVKWFRKDGSREALANIDGTNKIKGWNEHTMNEIIHTSLTESLSGITTTLDLINALITEYRAKQKPVRFISGSLTKAQLTDLPSNYGLLNITVAGYDLVEVRFARSEYGFKIMYYGFLNRTSSETLFSKLTWSKSNNIYYTVDELNAVKGTSIELVKGEDNTIKIIEALSDREEFVEWFNNGSTMDRFGIPDEFGNKITYLRIIKTDSQYALIIATTSRGFTFSRVYNLGVLEDWYYDKTKATLVTNTTTLKLDITKRNSGWYGAIKVTYLYDTSPAEIEISFRSTSDDLRWAVINGQKYINKITFTQDSSNTAHYTIGIQFAGTTYGCYQAEVIGGFADINSLTSEAFTGAKTAVYSSPWGKNNGVTLVSTPEDLGLTYPCTSVQLAQAMRDKFNKTIQAGAIGIFNRGGESFVISDTPTDYGLLHIETFGHDRMLIRYDGIGGSTYNGSWIGRIKGSNGTFSSILWEREDNNYSTTEQVVGTWIDGSTVYRTTIAYTFTSGAYQGNSIITIGNVSGCKLVVKMEGVVRTGTYDFKPIPFYTSSSSYGNILFSAYNGNVSFTGSALSEGAQIFVTMEYTKK